MAQFIVSGSGNVDLTGTDLSIFDGLQFGTQGNATALITGAQAIAFGPTATFVGSSARDTVQVTLSIGQSINASGWVLTDWNTSRDGFRFVDSTGNESITATAGNDTISISQGLNTANGGAGSDLLVVDWSTDDGSFSTSGSSYTDSVNTNLAFSGIERFDIRLGSGNDNITTGAGDDSLSGGGGNDSLNSGAGAVVIDGGAGTDLWAADFTADGTAKVIDLSLAGVQGAGNGTTYTGIERLNVLGGAGNDRFQSRTDNANDGLNDTLNGGLGNDTLVVGGGLDVANGGDGDDLLIIDWSTDSGSFLTSGSSFSDFANTNVGFSGIERFDITLGSGNDNIATGAGNDTLSGGSGDDSLNSGAGRADVHGGLGNDLWVADFTGTTTARSIDLLLLDRQAAGGQTFYESIERMNVTGGTGNDYLASRTGNPNDGLNDTLNGGLGNDTLVVGGGLDVANGGDGDDLLIIDWSTDAGNFSTSGGSFSDFANTNVGFSGIERFDIRLGSGNDNITTGAGNDTLSGGAGNDTLNGSDGFDLLDLTGAAGAATVTFSSATGGTASALGTGTDGFQNFERIDLADFDDSVRAGAGATEINANGGRDVLRGESGADTLNGGADVDRITGGRDLDVMTGGTGNDRFIFIGRPDSGRTGETADIITDFDDTGDIIDLSRLDAITGDPNSAFSWIGTDDFTAEGQVRYTTSGGNTYIEVNITGVDRPDMMIRLDGILTLDVTDLVL